MTSDSIHIVGAGPVGCLLACLLASRGRRVSLWEKRTGLPECSMAIGITPPSLDILARVGLRDRFVSEGRLIHCARVFENRQPVGELRFRGSEESILSFPQFGTERLLREKLAELDGVEFREGVEFSDEHFQRTKGWIIGCDGARSRIRQLAGIPSRAKRYGVCFAMADFPDNEDLGPDARLYFSSGGAVESFPLPGGHRRWVAQRVGNAPADPDYLIRRVHDAAGVDLAGRDHGPLSPFEPKRSLAETYVRGNVVLCGDAAHEMSPIGGQGMNTGFADAAMLSDIFQDPTPTALRAYTRDRQRAFRAASRRAAMGMWLGTRTGSAWSRFRRGLISTALRTRATHDTLARSYAMRNLPV